MRPLLFHTVEVSLLSGPSVCLACGVLHGAEILRTYCLVLSLSHGDSDEIAFFFFLLILHLVFVTLLQTGAGSNPQGAA